MNAMQISAATSPTTIKELKKYLADMEAAWTTEDSMYLGDFESQTLHIATPLGIGPAHITYNAGFGFISNLTK